MFDWLHTQLDSGGDRNRERERERGRDRDREIGGTHLWSINNKYLFHLCTSAIILLILYHRYIQSYCLVLSSYGFSVVLLLLIILYLQQTTSVRIQSGHYKAITRWGNLKGNNLRGKNVELKT